MCPCPLPRAWNETEAQWQDARASVLEVMRFVEQAKPAFVNATQVGSSFSTKSQQ